MQYVDCSNRGGYDRSDPCGHTCNDDEDLIVCPAVVVDCSELGGYDREDVCEQTCMLEPCPRAPTLDCRARGGYDPSDRCE